MEDSDIRESVRAARAELRKAMTLSEKLDTKLTNLLGSAMQRKAA